MTKTFEDHKERRGEPVIIQVRHGDRTVRLLGTIEWGYDRRGYSVCTEPAGARYIVSPSDMEPDPTGVRPLWQRRHGRPVT